MYIPIPEKRDTTSERYAHDNNYWYINLKFTVYSSQLYYTVYFKMLLPILNQDLHVVITKKPFKVL